MFEPNPWFRDHRTCLGVPNGLCVLPTPEIVPLIFQFHVLSGLELAFPGNSADGVEMVPAVGPVVPTPPERQAVWVHPSSLVSAQMLD